MIDIPAGTLQPQRTHWSLLNRPLEHEQGASPGFLKAGVDATFPDASAAVGGSLILVARATKPYRGYRLAFASGARDPRYSCEGGGSIPLSRGCWKSTNFTIPPTNEFVTVNIPFSNFSDHWAPPTGDHKSTCPEDKSTCVTAKVLSKIQRIEVWAEGETANIHLEVQSISARIDDRSQDLESILG